MTYFKAFDKNLCCRGMQYKIGEDYKWEGSPILCERGSHFCKTIADCYKFYPMNDDTRICEVEPLGEIVGDEKHIKFCTNHIRIVREIENPKKASNVSNSSSGYCNSGNLNSGDWNSGHYNSGDWNSGDWNSGKCNSGKCNSGNWNSGNCNSGDWNSGDWNSGNWNSGIFNTVKDPKIRIFDKESDWTMYGWLKSKACSVLDRCPCTTMEFIYKSDMSEDEKSNHPEYKTIGGYLKTITVTTKEKQEWWDNLPDTDKRTIYDLPNFDADKFTECTGIKIDVEVLE